MAKEIFVAYGVDVDAVAGWLGSFGGENSPDDISRGLFAGEVGTPRLLELFRRYGSDDLVHPRPLDRDLSARDRADHRGRSRDRDPRLHPREPARDEPRAGDRRARQCIDLIKRMRGKRPTGYMAPWWEFSNYHRAAARARDQIRPLAHGRGLPALLPPGRRLLDEDRLLEEGRGVDAAVEGRQGGRPGRAPGQLAPRRPAADDVRQAVPEQPRLGHRATSSRSGRTSSTGSTATTTTPSSRSPSTRTAPARRPGHARADHRHINGTTARAGRPSTRSLTISHAAARGT